MRATQTTNTRRRLFWVWGLPVCLFYVFWLALVTFQQLWPLVFAHWPMSVAMALGSYAAGSTPMGGGSVGFPTLVLLFDLPATLGRDFSFAIQAVGMTSASLFIIARRQPVAWSLLGGAMMGALLGLPVGLFLLAPYFSDLWIKLVFAVIWAGFGLLHLTRLNEIANNTGMLEFDERWDARIGMALGFIAACSMVAVTGVGIDMLVYSALVMLFRTDLKIAIPTSVIIMAFCSILGSLIKLNTTGFTAGVWGNWLAAAPIVAVGAPLGVYIVHRVGRKPTLLVVAALCVGQFIWTLYDEVAELGTYGVITAVLAVGALLLGFEWLHAWGDKLAGRRQKDTQSTVDNTETASDR